MSGVAGRMAMAALLAAGGVAQAGADAAITLPSGQQATFHDLFRDEEAGPATYRLRFVAPGIGTGAVTFEDAGSDMEFLCQGEALSRLAGADPAPVRVVVTLMSEPAEFGQANPDITQFFESFRIADDLCIWEVF